MRKIFWLACGALALAGCNWIGTGGPHASDSHASDSVEWPLYGHDQKEQRFSPLKQIDRRTVGQLGLAWSAALDSDRGQEATPIMVGGVLYVSTAWSLVYAFDAKTGKQLWMYDPQTSRAALANACCDAVNRGIAVNDGKVFVATLDGKLVAVDAKTGKLAWQVNTLEGAPATMRYTITGAVRAVKDKVVIGNSGAEFGARGFVTAYDAGTGKLAWRFYLTPNPEGKPDGAASDDVLLAKAQDSWGDGEWKKSGGGGTAWDAMTYDPEANLLYIGSGNGGPFDYQVRSGGKGDNLFLSSVIAVDPDTGKYAWHYQTTPGDSWDYTATQQIISARLTIDGKSRDVIMQAPKNGYFYVLDRQTGELLSAKPFAPVTWSTGIDMKTGRPILAPGAHYQEQPSLQQPGPFGAHSWQAMSYSPATGLVYIPVQLTSGYYEKVPNFKHRPLGQNAGIAMNGVPDDQIEALRKASSGQLLAWDPVAQQARWSVPKRYFFNGGTLATAGGLVFQGDIEGFLSAYDAAEGTRLWEVNAGRGIIAPPITYSVDGEQYVAVVAGFGGAGALMGLLVPDNGRANGQLLTFKLGGTASMPSPASNAAAAIDVTGLTSTGDPVAGEAEYARTCSACHGINAAVRYTADLRRSAVLNDPTAWQQVVHGGLLKDRGMVAFSAILTLQEVENIRAYVLHEARNAQMKGTR